jgi:hypothetical protein
VRTDWSASAVRTSGRMTEPTRTTTSTAVVGSFTAGDSARSAMSLSWRSPKSTSCCMVRALPTMTASRMWPAIRAGAGPLSQTLATGSPATR